MLGDHITRPEDINTTRSQKILMFLNSVHEPEEIAAVVDVPGRGVGVRLVRSILTEGDELPRFINLKAVADIPTNWFTKIHPYYQICRMPRINLIKSRIHNLID